MKLSIVITLYQSESYLPKCMESVLNQDISKSDYEIILVNDGSPDNSLALAREYAERYDNVVVLSHPNKGLAGARNTGLEAAHGKYLCFIDPDDYIETNSLSSLLEKMECDNLDMLRFNYQMVDEEYTNIKRPKDARLINYTPKLMTGKEFLSKRLGYGCFVWAYIYRTDIIKKNQISFTQGIYFDDTDWLPRVLCYVNRIDSLDYKRYLYVQREGSLVKTNDLKSTRNKINGQINIISILSQRKKFSSDKQVSIWYERMISKLTISVLQTVAQYFYEDRHTFVKELKDSNAFPLVFIQTTFQQSIHISLCKISINFYCWLISKLRN